MTDYMFKTCNVRIDRCSRVVFACPYCGADIVVVDDEDELDVEELREQVSAHRCND